MSDASKSLNILSVVGGSDFPSSSPTPTHAILKPPQPDADDQFDGPTSTHNAYTAGYIPSAPTVTGESSSAGSLQLCKDSLGRRRWPGRWHWATVACTSCNTSMLVHEKKEVRKS
ncbi:hypothetical protein DL96DRAFT_1816667 [Flagelloscypha sp. PMI_526]|nr:hypothetical protein DL96DRAFT_1816667 [Flagelloscypha sp. PMI_526]